MSKCSNEIVQFRECFVLRNHEIVRDDLWVRGGQIINPEPLFFVEHDYADVQIDCGGALIAPGFIDVQINGISIPRHLVKRWLAMAYHDMGLALNHYKNIELMLNTGGFGIDFSNCDRSNVEDGIQKVSKGMLAHGVTSFCPTLVTSPSHVYKDLLPLIPKSKGGPNGAEVLGVHIEGPFISKEKRGAHPTQHIRPIINGFEDLLDVYGALDHVKLLTLAPEIDQSAEIIAKLVQLGITVSLGHSMGNLVDGEKAVQSGATFITHLFNAMLPFHHRDPGLVGLLASNKIHNPVYYGIIADGIHTHPAALRIAHKTHPEGLVLVTDAVSPMGLSEGRHHLGQELVDISGSRAVIAGTQTLCGSIATMNQCVKTFIKGTGCSKVEALECASLHPAKALNLGHVKGSLDFGSDADFVMLDDELNVLATYIAGQLVWKNESWSAQVVKRISKHPHKC